MEVEVMQVEEGIGSEVVPLRMTLFRHSSLTPHFLSWLTCTLGGLL